ncbi:MmcQ/YjbR family DNA-binding protein [soil metagenome]
MASWGDVGRLALALPETAELQDSNGLKWEVRKRYFAWERPLRKRDIEALGDDVPSGPILGVRVADLNDKQGLIGSNPDVFFTIPHFAEYPAVLVLLDAIALDQLQEVLTDAWLCRAPKRLAAAFLA